jgi:hypothetical protein
LPSQATSLTSCFRVPTIAQLMAEYFSDRIRDD